MFELRPAVFEARAEEPELLGHVAGTDADDQPPAAEHIDRRQLLGGEDRLALRSTRIEVPRRMLLVWAAVQASVVIASKIRSY